ncbi:MAG: DinB family protein [Thermomicrobiales bacterium]
MDQNERLLQHDRWMTNLMYDAAATLGDEDLDRDFDIGYRTVRLTLDHITVGIELWTALLQGNPARWEPDPSAVETMRRRFHTAYDAFATLAHAAIAEGRLDQTFIDAWDTPQTIGSTILHVNLHSHVHRSELLHMYQRLGFAEFTQGDPQEWEHMAGITPPRFTTAIAAPSRP